MNENLIFLLIFFISTFFYGCATKEMKNFTLYLDGESYAKVNKNFLRKAKISGCSEKGVYKGLGVENGFFYPAKVKNGKHQIKLEGDKYIYVAYIEVIGTEIPVISACEKCDGKDLSCPLFLKNEKHRLECKKCKGQKKVKKACRECLKTKKLFERLNIFKQCKTCYGKKYIYMDCRHCNGKGFMPCKLCGYTDKVRCDKCN